MKKHLSTIILILVFFLGLSLLLYPFFSDYWNSMHQSHAIADYSQSVSTIDEELYSEIWQQAAEYNDHITERKNLYRLSDEEAAGYTALLDIGGTGVMGYIEIPRIKVSLPIYHGVDEGVLQIAVGHIEWSSLPVGGEGTHCVLSGHRGLPSSTLFTHLDRLEEGDVFMLRVLDEVLSYEVDQIRIVEPHELQNLMISEGEDLCTLVTCTPYGINSHRLLVRGHRVETENAATVLVPADAIQIEPLIVAPVVAAAIFLVLLIVLLLPKKH